MINKLVWHTRSGVSVWHPWSSTYVYRSLEFIISLWIPKANTVVAYFSEKKKKNTPVSTCSGSSGALRSTFLFLFAVAILEIAQKGFTSAQHQRAAAQRCCHLLVKHQIACIFKYAFIIRVQSCWVTGDPVLWQAAGRIKFVPEPQLAPGPDIGHGLLYCKTSLHIDRTHFPGEWISTATYSWRRTSSSSKQPK